jgi:hypothetical protein
MKNPAAPAVKREAEEDWGATEQVKNQLILKRASLSRSSGQWSDDDYDVLCEGEVVGRIYKTTGRAPEYSWFWGLSYVHVEEHTPYVETREAAMAAFRKSWLRE